MESSLHKEMNCCCLFLIVFLMPTNTVCHKWRNEITCTPSVNSWTPTENVAPLWRQSVPSWTRGPYFTTCSRTDVNIKIDSAFRLCRYHLRICIAYSVQQFASGWTVLGSNPARSKRCCVLYARPDQPRGPPSLLYNGQRGFFLGGKAAGTWPYNHSPTSSAEVKNQWSFTFTPPPMTAWRITGRALLLWLCTIL